MSSPRKKKNMNNKTTNEVDSTHANASVESNIANTTNNCRHAIGLGTPKGYLDDAINEDNEFYVIVKSRAQARRFGKAYSKFGIVMIGWNGSCVDVAWKDEAIEKGIEFQPITASLLTRLMWYAA